MFTYLEGILYWISFLILGSSTDLAAQCYDSDWHSTALTDIWLSCQRYQGPIADLSPGHWILYELHEPKAIKAIHLWNITNPEYQHLGAKEVRIDYSTDGLSWTQLDKFSLADQPNPRTYTGEPVPYFSAVTAQFLLITITHPRDPNCSGLAEVRIEVSEATTSTEDPDDNSISVAPVPADGSLQIDLHTVDRQPILYELYNELGTLVLRHQGSPKTTISTASLPDGWYLLMAQTDQMTYTQKVIILHP